MKQAILLRTDLDMSNGKSVAQGAHVSVLAARDADEPTTAKWVETGGKKIVLAVDSEEQLQHIVNKAATDGMPTATINDLGLTELPPDTLTAGAIGPADDADVDQYTGELPLHP